MIEEAAGLTKHRKRRHRAQLKLRRTQDNLDRALDVEREARSRLRPLKRQAEAAELHARLERQLLEARGELIGDELRDAPGRAGRRRGGPPRQARAEPRPARRRADAVARGARGGGAELHRAGPRAARQLAGAAVRRALGGRAARDPARVGAPGARSGCDRGSQRSERALAEPVAERPMRPGPAGAARGAGGGAGAARARARRGASTPSSRRLEEERAGAERTRGGAGPSASQTQSGSLEEAAPAAEQPPRRVASRPPRSRAGARDRRSRVRARGDVEERLRLAASRRASAAGGCRQGRGRAAGSRRRSARRSGGRLGRASCRRRRGGGERRWNGRRMAARARS